MNSIAHDIRAALRAIRASPAVSTFAFLSLTVVFAALTAAFTLADRALFRTLPARQPSELVIPRWHAGSEFPADSAMGDLHFDDAGRSSSTSFSVPAWEELRTRSRQLHDTVAFSSIERINAAYGDRSFVATGHSVSGSFFGFFDVRPALGRLLVASDDQPRSAPVAVLSHRFWRQRMGGSPNVVGQALRLDGLVYTIVGVAPAGFYGTIELDRAPDLFITLSGHAVLRRQPSLLADSSFWWVQILGRAPARDRAAEELTRLLRARVLESRPSYSQIDEIRVELLPGARGLANARLAYRTPILLVGGILALLFLLACMNAASLLLAKAMRRQREIATRFGLGASRARIASQLVVEATLLALAAALCGLYLAPALAVSMLRILPQSSATIALDTAVDGRIGLFALGLALVSGIALGLAPALRSTAGAAAGRSAADLLGSRSLTALRSPLAKVLVSAQVGLSLALLVASAVLVRSLWNINGIELGFDPDQVLQFRLSPTREGHSQEERVRLAERVRAAVSEIPGVERVSLSSHGVLTGQSMMKSVDREGGAPAFSGPFVWVNFVDPAFLPTLGIELFRGRGVEATDISGAPPVAVVNQVAASMLPSGTEPLGAEISLAGRVHTIVGVVRDAKYERVRAESLPVAYLPLDQYRDRVGSMTFDLRTNVAPAAIAPLVRDIVHRLDPDTPVFDLATQRELVARSTGQERAIAALASGFGLVAALLASIGLYGLLSFVVASRTAETGLRMALGAQRSQVLRRVLRDSLGVVLPGLAVGLPAALLAGRFLEKLLYEVSPRDPASTLVAALLMVTVALAASAVPAWRAASVDPVVALRNE